MEWELEDAEQLWSEIESQGFGYWIQEYGYEGDDKELEKLCEEAKFAMSNLHTYTQQLFDKYDLG